MRVCHLDTCPVGIATRTPSCASGYSGKPEFVEDVLPVHRRGGPRGAGPPWALRTPRGGPSAGVDLLRRHRAVDHWEGLGPHLFAILVQPETCPGAPCATAINQQTTGLDRGPRPLVPRACRPGFGGGQPVRARGGGDQRQPHGGHPARLRDHPAPTAVPGCPRATIDLTFHGSAGQSFRCLRAQGREPCGLLGDTNDYLARALSGGRIIVRPPEELALRRRGTTSVAGNVILVRATAGEVFLRGQVGERFCVRQLGCHRPWWREWATNACEYMTGAGWWCWVRPVGTSGAGMSGGVAYVLSTPRAAGTASTTARMVTSSPLSR